MRTSQCEGLRRALEHDKRRRCNTTAAATCAHLVTILVIPCQLDKNLRPLRNYDRQMVRNRGCTSASGEVMGARSDLRRHDSSRSTAAPIEGRATDTNAQHVQACATNHLRTAARTGRRRAGNHHQQARRTCQRLCPADWCCHPNSLHGRVPPRRTNPLSLLRGYAA